MSEGWQFVLDESSHHFILSLQAHDRNQLLKILGSLAHAPQQKRDFNNHDNVGRTIEVKVAAPFMISYWTDVLMKELRVINIERI